MTIIKKLISVNNVLSIFNMFCNYLPQGSDNISRLCFFGSVAKLVH